MLIHARHLALGLLVALVAPMTLAQATFAHSGGPEQIIVEGDHVDPGATVHAFGAFLEADADVQMHIAAGGQTWPLAPIHTTPDGTFDTRFPLPAGIPNGYAELVLTQPQEGIASTVFLVGPRTASTGADPNAQAASPSLVDGERLPALLLFGASLVGILAVGVLLLRGSSRKRT